MKKQNVKKTVLKEEELTKVVGGSTAHVGFNFLSKKLWNNIWKRQSYFFFLMFFLVQQMYGVFLKYQE